MFSDSAVADPTFQDDQSETADANGDSDAADKAQAFISQLEKQRSEQLAEIDGEIEKLQSPDESANESTGENTGEKGEDSAADEKAVLALAGLKAARKSIVSEYDAMIDAARQRINTP